jgi:threonyl-tRNA synthetase
MSAPLTLTLPNGDTRQVDAGTLPRDVVASIGPRLLNAAIAVTVDGEVQDLMTPLRRGGAFKVLTDKDAESLAVLRHSGAHILATAVRRLRPDAKIGFGPAIDDGFYYDFGVDKPFTPDDLAEFEAEMRKVVAEKYPFTREEVDRAEANTRFADDPLKLERIADLAEGEVISTYTDGPFMDLCRGPHVPDTSYLKHFKLTAHRRPRTGGVTRSRQMLQRIYATAFWKKEDLEQHLFRHRGGQAPRPSRGGQGARPLHVPPVRPRRRLLDRARDDDRQHDQRLPPRAATGRLQGECKHPAASSTRRCGSISGHWGKYRENMFLVLNSETEEHDMSLKPMNCPSHYLLFNAKKHSYRELPLRYNTYDVLHRNEITGALSGPHPRAPVPAGRLPHLPDGVADRRGSASAHGVHPGLLSDLRAHGDGEVRHPAAEVRVGTDEMWDRAEAGVEGRARVDRDGVRTQAG